MRILDSSARVIKRGFARHHSVVRVAIWFRALPSFQLRSSHPWRAFFGAFKAVAVPQLIIPNLKIPRRFGVFESPQVSEDRSAAALCSPGSDWVAWRWKIPEKWVWSMDNPWTIYLNGDEYGLKISSIYFKSQTVLMPISILHNPFDCWDLMRWYWRQDGHVIVEYKSWILHEWYSNGESMGMEPLWANAHPTRPCILV